MILKRKEKDDIIKVMYDSSNILASIYNNQTNDLDLIFKAGTKYRYSNVSKSDYMRFEIAESQGNVFNSHIKKYSFTKLENVDPTKILDEAEDLKAKENAALIEGKKLELVYQLKQVVLTGEVIGKDVDFYESLTKLNLQITDFLTLINKH